MTENVKIVKIDTGSAVSSVKDLKSQVDELRASLASLKEGTQEYIDTVNQLSQAQDKLKTVMNSAESMKEIDMTKSITSVADLKHHINELRDSLVTLDAGSEQYDAVVQELVASQTKLNEVMAVTRGTVSAQEGSYNALVNQMSALKVAWRATTSEVQRSQLGEKIRQINDQLKAYDETIGNHQRKVGSYKEAIDTLNTTFNTQKQELAALKVALENLEPGTEAYNEAFTRAAEITHQLKERQEQLRMSANDLGTQLSNLANIGAGLVGGFNSINAIMVLTGQKNEDLQKTMVKLQAGIALVQGLKGIEGAVKSLKAYAQWAANTFDRIAGLSSGQKALQKEIEATTTATNANAAANKANAAAETQSAVGAGALSTGMRSAAASTTVATGAMVAFKAVLMSLGIGVVVAGIAGLVTLIDKIGSSNQKALEANNNATKNHISNVNKWRDDEIVRLERQLELLKAQGGTEEEVYEQTIKVHEKIRDMYDNDIASLNKLADAAKKLVGSEYDDKKTVRRADNQAKLMQAAGFDSSVRSFEYFNQMFEQMSGVVIDYEERTARGVRKWSDELIVEFDRVKEEGIKTWDDLAVASKGLALVLGNWKRDYKFDPLEGFTNSYIASLHEANTEAQNFLKSEITIENESYKAQLEAFQKYGIDASALTKAHRKKIYDIVTGATQSIIDNAKATNQTELQNLEDKYNKEYKILKKYGRDTTELTKAYEKQRKKILLDDEVKAIERAVSEMDNIASQAGNIFESHIAYYNRLAATGKAKASDLAKAQAAAQEEQFQYTTSALEQQMNYWKDLYAKIENDSQIDKDKRLEIYYKYIEAANKLEDERTKHLLDQIKVRKEATDAEIQEIKDRYEKQKVQNQNQQAQQDMSDASGFGGFWNVWAGNVQNPSFEQQQQAIDIKFNLDIESLNEQLAVYQGIIDAQNTTDAERTAAMEQQAEIRNQIYELETQKAVESANIQIDKQKELINTIVDVGNSIGAILGSVADAWENSVDAQVKAGKMSEKQAEEEKEKIRGLQIVQALINMAAGSFGAFAQASETIPPPYGQIVGAAAAATVIAAGIAQIAAIKSASENSSGSGGSTMMAQVTPAMIDYQPQMVGNATGEQETENLVNALNGVNLYVRVTDIDEAQERGRVRVDESTY